MKKAKKMKKIIKFKVIDSKAKFYKKINKQSRRKTVHCFV